MKIGIIGAGSVGQVIGKGLIDAGHQVTISSRTPQQDTLNAWQAAVGPNGQAATFEEAARFGDLLIIAIHPWTQIESVLKSIPQDAFTHKTVIDVSNAVEPARPVKLALPSGSVAELIQTWLPTSYIVKTLNTVHVSHMSHPSFADGTPIMFVAGDQAQAKEQITGLLHDLGWSDVIDVGDLSQSRLIEAFALMCITVDIKTQSTAVFGLLKR